MGAVPGGPRHPLSLLSGEGRQEVRVLPQRRRPFSYNVCVDIDQDEINAEADRLLARAAAEDLDPAAEIARLIALADPAVPYVSGQKIETMTDLNNAIAHMLLTLPPAGYMDTTAAGRRAATVLMPLQLPFDLSLPGAESPD